MNEEQVNLAIDGYGNITANRNITAGANGYFNGTVNLNESGTTLGTIQANGISFINYNGSSTVGLNLAGGTYSQNAIRISANQSIAWESTGVIQTSYNSNILAWQFSNGDLIEMQVSTGAGASWFAGSVGTGGSSGPYWKSGSGAPTYAAPKGSMYSRTDGGVGSTLYVSQGAGSWNAVSGV